MNEIKMKIEEAIVYDPKVKTKYRLSNLYIFRSFILITIILFTIFYVGMDLFKDKMSDNYFTIFILLALIIYIIFHLNTVLKFKIYVDENEIRDKNNKVMINQIEKLSIRIMRISKNSNENCLIIKTKDKKEYIYRLNINNKYRFIKQISVLTNLDVIIEE
ncbi:hypothetical protein [Streptobacillus moniliformis]|uniref:hypothetical protein n=1 Tax=Streptobacillus moniliformis TaxID=34105 RepID=UPI0007E47E04|nr:hypothetical protein [Streptobacillus moniliformis]